MEIGFLGLDRIQGSVTEYEEALKPKWVSRNEGFEQNRFRLSVDDCRVSKIAKTSADFSPDSNSLILENSGGSADKLRFFCHPIPENSALPYLQHMASAYTKNAGYYYSGGSSGVYLVSGERGTFTQSQWHELEHQALIYKYMKENEPIPLQLLIPIVEAFEPPGLFGFNDGPFRPTSWGMGPFHLGYSRSTDPEPGRCRRTDGKKWRCSRDAVATQKYCERHMNRGRHRSRKHVEGQANATKPTPPSSCQNQYQMNAFADTSRSDEGMKQVDWSGCKYQAQWGDNGFGVPSQLSSLSPMSAADFMSSTTDLNMGLGVGPKEEARNWSSVSYGPLGEALQSSTDEK